MVRIAGGVLQDGERLVAVKAGVLQHAKNGQVLWVQSRQRRWALLGVHSVFFCSNENAPTSWDTVEQGDSLEYGHDVLARPQGQVLTGVDCA